MSAIRVRITAVGFIGGQIRRPDDELTLADKRYFSARWMELLSEAPSQEPAPAEAALEEGGESAPEGDAAEPAPARARRSK